MFCLPPGLANSQRQQVPTLKHALDMQSSAVTCPPPPPPPPRPPSQSLAPIPLQAFCHNHPRNRVAEHTCVDIIQTSPTWTPCFSPGDSSQTMGQVRTPTPLAFWFSVCFLPSLWFTEGWDCKESEFSRASSAMPD